MNFAPATRERSAAGVPSAAGQRGEPVIAIRDLAKRYGRTTVLEGITLSVWPGELVVVLGANGSGKSTMLRCLVRLTDPTAGSAMIAGNDFANLSGRELRERRREVAMVFQQSSLVARRSAVANVACGRLGRRRGMLTAAGVLSSEEMSHAFRCLERVQMAHVGGRRADLLSGGEAQRVAIARALCQGPKALLADEPVASLDPEASESVMALLRDLATTDGLAILCVLHQPDLALRFADRIVGLRGGAIVYDLPPAHVAADLVRGLYQDEMS